MNQYNFLTHSVDSICSVGGRIIMMQLRRMVTMMMREKRGWTSTWMATLRTGENGERNHMESSAEKRKMSLPLLITTKVWKCDVKCGVSYTGEGSWCQYWAHAAIFCPTSPHKPFYLPILGHHYPNFPRLPSNVLYKTKCHLCNVGMYFCFNYKNTIRDGGSTAL